MKARTIKVSVVSDIICPWCYICAKELDNAIERVQRLPIGSSIKFEFEHKPFFLNPSFPEDECKPKRNYLISKLGKDRLDKVQHILNERGKKVGINFTGDDLVFSTRRAHRLLLLAWNKGGADAQIKLLHALYRACFEANANLGDVDILASYAEETGLMTKNQAVDFLKSDELETDIKRMTACVQRNNVTGVPFTVIDGRWAVSGGQSSDVFYRILEKIAQGEEP